jgi:hypothetical protein
LLNYTLTKSSLIMEYLQKSYQIEIPGSHLMLRFHLDCLYRLVSF